MMSKLTLISSDNRQYLVDKEVAFVSPKLKRTWAEIGEERPIRLEGIESKILKKVIAWCARYKNDQGEDQSQPKTAKVSHWDNRLLTVNQSVWIDLTAAADNLEIKGIRMLVDRKLQEITKNLTLKQLEEKFGSFSIDSAEEIEELIEAVVVIEEVPFEIDNPDQLVVIEDSTNN